MEKNPANKVVVVTGGANGIGYEIANHFLKEHAKIVIIVDINKEQGLRAVEQLNDEHGEGKSVFYRGDVTTDLEEVCGNIFKEYNQVDVLVNSAGVIDDYDLRKVIGINTIALVEWSMKFFEHMRTDKNGKGGTIINIASIVCFLDLPYYTFYKTSKCGVLGFTISLGHEKNYGKFGVRTIAMCPSSTKSNLLQGATFLKEHEEDLNNFFKDLVFQEASLVGEKSLEAFKIAESGSVWKVVRGVMEKE